jgi:AcrR family transcriptional regulator
MSARAATPRPADAQTNAFAIEPFETQGERRRAQILAITAKIVVTDGPESVSHATVAKRAGLVRSAVYRYFPTRDDLLAGLLTDYSKLHADHISAEDAAAGVRALAKASSKRIPPETRLLLEKLWDPEDWSPEVLELRLAIITLQRDAELLARLHAAHPELARQQTVELTEPLRQLGLDPIEIRIVVDAILAVLYHAVSAALTGSIDRDQAMRLTYRLILAAVQAFSTTG